VVNRVHGAAALIRFVGKQSRRLAKKIAKG
jgi:hypothetical protein